jgi:hypothetical protein
MEKEGRKKQGEIDWEEGNVYLRKEVRVMTALKPYETDDHRTLITSGFFMYTFLLIVSDEQRGHYYRVGKLSSSSSSSSSLSFFGSFFPASMRITSRRGRRRDLFHDSLSRMIRPILVPCCSDYYSTDQILQSKNR